MPVKLSPLPKIQSPRLILRPVNRDDAGDMFAYASNPAVAATTTWNAHENLAQTLQRIDYIIRLYRQGKPAPWGIEHRADSKLIGTIGFGEIALAHRRASVGFALSEDYWNRGLMTEAVRAVLAYGFEHLQLNRIQAMCLPENIGSARVLEKVGMRYEGLLRQYLLLKGAYADLKLYAILREEFAAL